MKVNVIYSDSKGVVGGESYSLADCYTSQLIEDYLYKICEDSVTDFQWFVENKGLFGSCIINKEAYYEKHCK